MEREFEKEQRIAQTLPDILNFLQSLDVFLLSNDSQDMLLMI